MDRASVHLLPDQNRRPLTPDEQATIEDCLDAATAWAAGNLPWQDAAAIGTLRSPSGAIDPGYSRFCAALWAFRNDDPRRHALADFCTHIAKMCGWVVTDQGVYSAWELRHHDDAIRWIHDHPTREAA